MSKLRDSDKKTALIMRLRRREGQPRGGQKLMDEEADCEKIAQQLAASRKALDKTFFAMVGCIIEQEDAVEPAKRGRTGKTPSVAASRGELLSDFLEIRF